MAMPLPPLSDLWQSCLQLIRLHLVVRARHWRKHRCCACWVFLIFVSTLPLTAQNGGTPLAELRTELDHLRAEAPQHEATHGATPRLTTIKHELRDWVESQLGQVSSDPNGVDGAESVLAERLNTELKREHLFGDTAETTVDNPDSGLGFLGPVNLEYRQRQTSLVLETFIGIQNWGLMSLRICITGRMGIGEESGKASRTSIPKKNIYPKSFARCMYLLLSRNLFHTS
jgi:hypothetical protein